MRNEKQKLGKQKAEIVAGDLPGAWGGAPNKAN
jgi:hypothetical protein